MWVVVVGISSEVGWYGGGRCEGGGFVSWGERGAPTMYSPRWFVMGGTTSIGK